jgi:hypothetical protein
MISGRSAIIWSPAPKEAPTVARLASIPHGTTILAQGTASTSATAPSIPNVRTSGTGLIGITQQMVNNPNSILRSAIAAQRIQATTTLHMSTSDGSLPGGGTANTAFLRGAAQGPNAVAARVAATFWLETLRGDPGPLQLQYSQTVLLNFNGLSWPHITVATLHKAA